MTASGAIVRELDSYVTKGSVIRVVGSSEKGKEALAGLDGELANLKASYAQADITSRGLLESLELGKVDHLIVMCEDGDYDPDAADSRTLVTLIHVRDMAKKGGFSFSLTSQILDIRNRALAEVAEADDFIVSDRILSLMVAQLSENPGLIDVLTDLFDPEGSEIYIKHRLGLRPHGKSPSISTPWPSPARAEATAPSAIGSPPGPGIPRPAMASW